MSKAFIGDLNKDILLKKLWDNANYSKFSKPCSFDLAIAKKGMVNCYPDYVCGKSIKVDIYNQTDVDYCLYDRDTYDGAFLQIVKKLRMERDDGVSSDVNDVKKLRMERDDGVFSDVNGVKKKIAMLTDDQDVRNEATRLYYELF